MYRKFPAEDGEYVDADGVRYCLEWCRRVRPAEGWTEFETPEKCLEIWGLTCEPLMAQ